LDLPKHHEFDLILQRVSALSNPAVPQYLAVDLHYGWTTPHRALELSITGQNLFGSGHGEFTDRSTRTEFGRGVFFKITSRFGQS
jgi:iron complex outermembrane receptor protein